MIRLMTSRLPDFAAGATFLLTATPALAQSPAHHSAAGASAAYWAVAFSVFFGFLIFAIWALYGRHREGSTSNVSYHALGALVPVMTLFTLALYMVVARGIEQMPPTDRAWNWRPGEVLQDPGGSDLSGEPYRGYEVYLANGCTYCHTLYIRSEDIPTGWAPGAQESDVSEPGDFAHYPYTLLGTQRNGPDLSIAGKLIPDMGYQIAHLKTPRQFKPRSMMPHYAYLPERDLNDLAAYLVSLGRSKEQIEAGTAAQAAVAMDPQLAEGNRLYRSLGCVGCHSVDGSPNVGPTFQSLFGNAVTLANGGSRLADEDFLRESIILPNATLVQGYPPVMPPYPQLADSELDALVAFIKATTPGGH